MPRLPWVTAHSGASAARVRIAAEIIPKGVINAGQSLSHGLWPCQLPLHKGALGDGGRWGQEFFLLRW